MMPMYLQAPLRYLPLVLPLVALTLLSACPGSVTVEGMGCGDGIVEEDEQCDDANRFGGDGCTLSCTVEEGSPESEPNDTFDDAEDTMGGGLYHGRLTEGDKDCFLIEVLYNAAVGAWLDPDVEGGSCKDSAVIELLRPDGLRVVAGPPSLDNNCPALDPFTENRVRYLEAGPHVLCVAGVFDAVVRGYNLRIETFDSCEDLPPLAADPDQDLDADGLADICDPDDDGDGVDDSIDNCPTKPNGPKQPLPWDTSNDGFVPSWLFLGPFTTGATPGGCEPSPDDFTGPADADAAPALGDIAAGLTWFTDLRRPSESATFWFTDYFDVPAPRENYAFVWVNSPTMRDANIAIGADDGFKVWLNGVEEEVIAGCQGVNTDQFSSDLSLQAGWNRLLIKVYDQGGGWGLILRFRDITGAPMTDLGVSIGGPMPWTDNQGDIDGDGLGDICDPDPANP